MKKYILIAGVNGAGKSTLFQTLESLKDMPRINTDEIAKSLGYRIELHYVGVASADIAKTRIAYRVSQGGHGIPDADVERRYTESFNRLREIISLCDMVVLYDNTKNFNRFAIYQNGKLCNLSDTRPDWYNNLNLSTE